MEIFADEITNKTMEKQIKMSLETAKKLYADLVKSSGAANESLKELLLENFTIEELEPKKGFTWEDSISKSGYFINEESEVCAIKMVNDHSNNKAVFKEYKQAQSALAFSQLSHIVAKYNEGKKSSAWAFSVFCLNYREGFLSVEPISFNDKLPHMIFLTKADSETSLDVNLELWRQYWMLD